MLPITPLGKRVLIKPIKQDTVTASGLYLTATAFQETPEHGEVVAVAEGYDFKVKVGDKVMYRKYAGDEIEWKEEKYMLMEEEVLIAKVN